MKQLGWIQVSGTKINYPFVKHSDNDFYLNHSFDKSRSNAGWVYMDYRNNFDNLDDNTILYAHRMRDDTMFSTLKNVLTAEWFKNPDNHIIKISTETNNSLWQIYSVYHIPITDDYLKTSFESDEEFQEFIDLTKKRSMQNFDTTPTINDKIITLSTCYTTNSERMVVHAKLLKSIEK